jgi:hypothetical protein
MQTKLAAAALVLAIAILLAAASIPTAAGAEPQETLVVYVQQPSLTPAQIIWLARLMQCESGMRAEALNPFDTNGLPSRGILQFQDATFAAYTAKYEIPTTTPTHEAQVEIVAEWLLNPGTVTWGNQFPACVRKLGEPPVAA